MMRRLLRPVKFLPGSKEGSSMMAWVIAVMVFLLTLSIAFGLMLHNATANWTADLTRTLTVQIVESELAEKDRQTKAAIAALVTSPGVITAEVIEENAVKALLEPWLGEGNITSDLPLPGMIHVVLDPDLTLNIEALRARIQAVAPGARLDDHQQWIGQVVTLSRAVELSAALVALLIATATAVIVIFATQARLSSWHETVDLVHMLGATDHVIAGEFRDRFFRWGLKGGIIGFLCASIVIWGLSALANNMAQGLIPMLRLSLGQYFTLFTLPVLTALLSMQSASMTVKRSLAQKM